MSAGGPGALLRALADKVADARVAFEEAQALADEKKATYDTLEAAMFDAMEASGLESIRTERGLFRLNDLAWARIADPDKARVWAELHQPELLTLNNARLSKIIRDALRGESVIEGGEPDPQSGVLLPTGVTYTTSRKITWRRQ